MADEGEASTTSLSDVLSMVPLADSVWQHLPHDVARRSAWQRGRRHDTGGRGRLRLTSAALRSAADRLISGAIHDLTFKLPATAPLSSIAAAQSTAITRREGDAVWRLAADARSAFLATLPNLVSLRVQLWSCEADLVRTLRRYDTATLGSRITVLDLDTGPLAAAAAHALAAAFPRLRQLTLSARVGNGSLSGDVFLELQTLDHLTELDITNSSLSRCALGSLSGLSRLRSLKFGLWWFSRDDMEDLSLHLPLLSGLVNLQHLSLTFYQGHYSPSLVDLSPLFSLTSLTSLHLPDTHGLHTPPQPDPADAALTAAAMAALGGMSRLRSLHLCRQCVIDDSLFGALGRLTQVTRLAAHSIRLTRPVSTGFLPLLKELDLGFELTPSQLLHTLLPLLPLPMLERLGDGLRRRPGSRLSVDARAAEPEPGWVTDNDDSSASTDADVDEVDTEAAALLLLATHLAAAPQLRTQVVQLALPLDLPGEDSEDEVPPTGRPLTLLEVAHSLAPLAGQVTRLELSGWPFSLDDDWGALGTSLPALSHLELSCCEVSEPVLVGLFVELLALEHLNVSGCEGAPQEAAAWQALAVVGRLPVQLVVEFSMSTSAPLSMLLSCPGQAN